MGTIPVAIARQVIGYCPKGWAKASPGKFASGNPVRSNFRLEMTLRPQHLAPRRYIAQYIMATRRLILPQLPHSIAAPSAGHELVNSGPIFAMTSPTRVDRIHLSSALPVVDDMPQGKGKSEVAENPEEVRLTDSLIPWTHPQHSLGNSVRRGISYTPFKDKATMVVRPLIGRYSPDAPAAVTCVESPVGLNYRPEIGSVWSQSPARNGILR
jgi:hypothetical protein